MKMINMIDYLKQFTPPLDRSKDKYYSEMQQLAYNLVKYLSMNNTENEHCFQGNYNMTYLAENMTDEDFKSLANMFLRKIPMGEVRQMIHSTWGDESAKVVLDKESELEKDYYKLIDEYEELKERYINIQETLKGLIELSEES